MRLPYKKIQLFVLVSILYVGIQVVLLHYIKSSVVFYTSVIPIILISRLQGYRAAIAMGAALMVIHLITFQWAFKQIIAVDFFAGYGSIVIMTLVAVVFGRMAELTRTIRTLREKTRSMEIEKTRLQEQLCQCQKMDTISQVSGCIAHDFNNILAAISGYAELITLKFSTDNEVLKKYASCIYKATQNAAEITSKLVTISRKGKLEIFPFNLSALISNVTDIITQSIDKRISVEHNLEANDYTVLGDAAQLQNSLLNLALNAVDAMPQGGVITMSTQLISLDDNFIKAHCLEVEPGEYVRLCVIDTGVGIDIATLSRVFEPFFTTKARGNGAGLGLSIVYGTVKAHGGHVEIDSTVGVGTKLSVYLPVVQMSRLEGTAHCDIAKENGFVLMIDDEPMVRDVVSEMICDLGFKIKICADGVEGIAYYRQYSNNIDIVILDLMMPNMGGYDCLKELRKINPSVRVIVASGYAGKEDVKKFFESGITTFLKKPFTRKDLSEAVFTSMSDLQKQ